MQEPMQPLSTRARALCLAPEVGTVSRVKTVSCRVLILRTKRLGPASSRIAVNACSGDVFRSARTRVGWTSGRCCNGIQVQRWANCSSGESLQSRFDIQEAVLGRGRSLRSHLESPGLLFPGAGFIFKEGLGDVRGVERVGKEGLEALVGEVGVLETPVLLISCFLVSP